MIKFVRMLVAAALAGGLMLTGATRSVRHHGQGAAVRM
jgi:hypothetical protein